MPLAPVRVRSQAHLPRVSRLSCRSPMIMDANEMILGAVHRSPWSLPYSWAKPQKTWIYFTIKSFPRFSRQFVRKTALVWKNLLTFSYLIASDPAACNKFCIWKNVGQIAELISLVCSCVKITENMCPRISIYCLPPPWTLTRIFLIKSNIKGSLFYFLIIILLRYHCLQCIIKCTLHKYLRYLKIHIYIYTFR